MIERETEAERPERLDFRGQMDEALRSPLQNATSFAVTSAVSGEAARTGSGGHSMLGE